MPLSFIIGFHTNRIANLLQTLRFLEYYHIEVVESSELVLLCQDECDHIPNKFRECQHRNLQFKNMHLPKLTNIGAEMAQNDKLVILESDRILPSGYFSQVEKQLRPGLQITTLKMIKLLQDYSDEEIQTAHFAQSKDETRSQICEVGRRNMWSGNTAITKEDYWRIGGMDEQYTGYGWADNDMTLTTERAGIKSIYRDELEIHLHHANETYGDADQKRLFVNNGLYFCKKWGVDIPLFLKSDMHKYTNKGFI